MTLVPDNQSGVPYLPSGKEIATLQQTKALLENKVETLRKQCNFFDSLLKQKAKAVAELRSEDWDKLFDKNKKYIEIAEQFDKLWTGLQQGQEDLELLQEATAQAEEAKEKIEKELVEKEKELGSRTEELRRSLGDVDKEKVQAINERNQARREHADLVVKMEKLRNEYVLHEETMEAERKAIYQEKQAISRQVRDLAIKHGRLQRVAAKMGVKGV